MKQKLVLDIDLDFLMYGISCHAKDFKLAWGLNQALGIDFERIDDFVVYHKDLKCGFAYFVCENEETHLRYSLIANRSTEGVFLPERKELDYFLIVDGAYDQMEINTIVGDVRKTDSVLAVFEIDPNKLKAKDLLIFE